MKKNDVNETLLAEIIEQNGKLQKDLLGMKKAIDGLSDDLTKFANQFSPMPKSDGFEEMVPKKDADERARFLILTFIDLQDKYAQLKADYGELQAKTRHWASNQWAKHLFRWLFIKRHLWIWVVYALFCLCLCLSISQNVEKEKRIESLENADLKYRYIRAKHACPFMVNWVDSVFEFGSASELQLVRSEIDNYERSIKLKCDSLVKAETKKRERYQ